MVTSAMPGASPVPHLRTCLIVDNHAGVRGVLRDFLLEETREIWECENGREAVEIYERERPGFVLMDIAMPVMNGLEATALILARHPEALIIVVSNHSDPISREQARRVGAVAFLCKSELYELPTLLASVVANYPTH